MSVFYAIYEFDIHNNKKLICGAGSKQTAEEALKKHKGYEDKKVAWKTNPIYGSQTQLALYEGIIE